MKIPNNVWVVIPAHNEAKHIADVLQKTKQYAQNILVVDDGSTDNTAGIAKKTRVRVLQLQKNQGKGAALRTGCDYAMKHGAKAIITMDADGQHAPAKLPAFAKALQGNDIVFGQRLFAKQMPWLYRVGNWGLDMLTWLLGGIHLRDTQCGYRAFTAHVYKKIRWAATKYSIESEVVVRTAKNKLKYTTVQVPTIYHEKNKGTTPLDGIKILWNLIKLRLQWA